ncbi:FKBP-type peptidyl-prolyl cis-trans isomerase [Flectobacillus sp. DC10W]|uniref:Peptidyl-prolyl cis-trans isomerase n=1 Tax=Flectobacillus longus TaxID=2984207 RepID=A0ABT6YMI9_9BACT|nr:FKBP-type peptidyl-prolyl cis-trans isomerase [Flectobacillus longus]MDI9864802.1 FKBP-type peptidyl-prolyl cis-trans isomerase [Flectobacillus longus]
MKNIKSLYVLGLFAIVVLLSSCLSTIVLENDEIVKQNETKIQTYLSSQSLSFTKATNGIYYTAVGDTSGRVMTAGDTVRVQYTISRLDGVKIDSSVTGKPFQFIYGNSTSIFVKTLPLLHESQQGSFIIPSTQALGSQTFPNLPANSPIRLDVKWFKTYSEAAYIDNYILANKITVTAKYTNGLRYIRTQDGTGDYMASGKIAKVKYTGKLLNGFIFDSNVAKTDTFKITIGGSSAITGFQRGVELMKVGEKATLIFPSSIGYGTTGSLPKIPGESPLIFDVQVIAVSDN